MPTQIQEPTHRLVIHPRAGQGLDGVECVFVPRGRSLSIVSGSLFTIFAMLLYFPQYLSRMFLFLHGSFGCGTHSCVLWYDE